MSEPGWSNKSSEGTYGTYSSMQVFQALGLKSFGLPTPIALLAQALPPTATMLGGHLAGSLLNVPYNDIDIWCIKGDGSPFDDTVAAVEQTLLGPTFTPGNYVKSLSANGTAIYRSETMPSVMVHRFEFDSVNALMDCVDFTINQIVTVGVDSFTVGATTLLDLRNLRLRYAQPPTAKSPLIKELRDQRLRKYLKRGFAVDPSVAHQIRGYSPLLANQLQADSVRRVLVRPGT